MYLYKQPSILRLTHITVAAAGCLTGRQVCPLDCREATGLNATQRGWLQPPYAISNSLQRLGLGVKVIAGLPVGRAGLRGPR